MTNLSRSALLLAIGAAFGFVPSVVLEIMRRRHEIQTRWDEPLYELTSSFAEAARNLLHFAERLGRAEDKAAYVKRIDEEHADLRAAMEKIRLLGSEDLQVTAGLVIFHTYSVRRVGEGLSDKHFAEFRIPARDRLNGALDDFYKAARSQLRVKNPDAIQRYKEGRAVQR